MINVSDQQAPHAPRSLIVTLYGAYGRSVPGPVPVAELIRLLAAVGVDAPSVRSSVSRLKRRGLLVPARTAQGAAGYELSLDARQLLVWIAPARLYEETRHTLQRLRLDAYVDFFRGEHLGFAPTAEAVARWWDLAGIAEQHEAFLDRHARVLRAWERRTDTPPEDAYRDYLLALDSWRHLPSADPGLPAALLPADWPGTRSAAVFRGLHERLRDAGAVFVGV
jgi:phenylacetic acid degradation operon negative regulatory protein